MSVVEAALLVACGTIAAIALASFAEARRRSSRPPV
jgi:EamA domain-containing membrane protein RarD